MSAKPRVLILGGGFAALETAFLLRMRARDRVDISLVSDNENFVFRPNTIYVPFRADPDSLLVDLSKPLHKRDIDFHHGTVTAVDPDNRLVSLANGERLHFDKLVIATGASMAPDEVPGLSENAATIWTADTMLGVRERFEAWPPGNARASGRACCSSSRRATSAPARSTRSC